MIKLNTYTINVNGETCQFKMHNPAMLLNVTYNTTIAINIMLSHNNLNTDSINSLTIIHDQAFMKTSCSSTSLAGIPG